VEAADVIIEVLDARDPLATRCTDVERYVRKSGATKKLILLLNKIGRALTPLPWDIILHETSACGSHKQDICSANRALFFYSLDVWHQGRDSRETSGPSMNHDSDFPFGKLGQDA